ncbi:hypothetical protein GYA19_02980 [Candidatus Beckwithbacteria bacterium]|nr:hypothetical protein [Candidatus Beckwithbacteria bacterium]
MNTKQIYENFLLPQNLQKYVLRAASLASIIADHWTGEKIDKNAIIKACLFHDLTKPMMFDLSKQSQFIKSKEELDNLKILQKRLIENYGTDEHKATVKACKQLGFPPKALQILKNLQ